MPFVSHEKSFNAVVNVEIGLPLLPVAENFDGIRSLRHLFRNIINNSMAALRTYHVGKPKNRGFDVKQMTVGRNHRFASKLGRSVQRNGLQGAICLRGWDLTWLAIY